METIKRVLRSKSLQLAAVSLVDGAVIFDYVSWSVDQVAFLNGALITWIALAQVIFEVDLHKLAGSDDSGFLARLAFSQAGQIEELSGVHPVSRGRVGDDADI